MKLIVKKYIPSRDAPMINSWSHLFGHTKEYQNIVKYIVENNPNYSVSDIINRFYSFTHCNYADEKMFVISVLNELGNLVGVAVFDYCNYDSPDDGDLIIKYLLINPEYQNNHYGSGFLKYILLNAKKYFNSEPHKITALVDRDNFACLTMFDGLGFKFANCANDNYYVASATYEAFLAKLALKTTQGKINGT